MKASLAGGDVFAAAAFATSMSLVSPAHAISIGDFRSRGLAGLSVGALDRSAGLT